MKDLKHYFQSPASAAKKVVSSGEDKGKQEENHKSNPPDSFSNAINSETVAKKVSTKRNVLSLKRASENGKSKNKNSSKQEEINKETNSTDNEAKDSPKLTKKRGRKKKGATSPDSGSENKLKRSSPVPIASETRSNAESSKEFISPKDESEALVQKASAADKEALEIVSACNAKDELKNDHGIDQETKLASSKKIVTLSPGELLNERISDVANKNSKDLQNEPTSSSMEDVQVNSTEPLTKSSSDGCSSSSETEKDNGRVSKKLKLEEKSTECADSKNRISNAFQFMMCSSSKKSANLECKKHLEKEQLENSVKENIRSKHTKNEEASNKRKISKDSKGNNCVKSNGHMEKKISNKKDDTKTADAKSDSSKIRKEKEVVKKESAKTAKSLKLKKTPGSDQTCNEKTENIKMEDADKTNKVDKIKKKDGHVTEKSPDAFKLLMSSKKQLKVPDKSEDNSEEEVFKKSKNSKSKRKRVIISDDDDDDTDDHEEKVPEAKPSKPSGLLGYFSPVSRDESRKRANEILVTKTVKAEVHQAPIGDSPDEGRRHSVGPKRRSQQSSQRDEEEIIVISVEESTENVKEGKEKKQVSKGTPDKPKKLFKFKTPEKKKRRRPWQLKVRLLSPAKPLEDLSDTSGSSCSDSDSDCIEIAKSPKKKQSDLKALWSARGKEMHLAPIFMSKNKNTLPLSNSGDIKIDRKIVSSATMPLMRPAPTEHTIGFAEVDPATPMSILFPSISHITQSKSTKNDFEETFPHLPTPASEVPTFSPISPGSLINMSELSQGVSTAVQAAISKNMDSEGNGESWCDKYHPTSVANVAGNARSVQRLKVWLDGWRQRSMIADNKSQRSSDSESSDYSSTDDFIVSDDASSTEGRSKKKKKKKHCNTALLVGPCGSGKTATVYAAAEELGYKVLEMNASSRRSGKRILSELQEATQSHQVRNNAIDQDTLNSFFGATNKGKDKKKDQAVESQQQPSNNSGLSLILVEDVDVVFEEQDEGFIAALNVLAASSKRPLILVSNEPQCPLLLARQHRLHLEFKKVASTLTSDLIKEICSAEKETLADSQLQHLMKACKGDLRRAVLLAQTWTLTGGFPQLTTNEMLPFPLNLSDLWMSMKHAPLPYILTEDEVALEETVVESEHDSDSDHIFSPPKKKQKVKRLRLTSDSLDKWEPSQHGSSCSNLKKMSCFSDMLATLDIMQGSKLAELNFSSPRPGLSDQPCYSSVPDYLGPKLQHWLASKAVAASGCSLSSNTSEHRDSWRESHRNVDKALLEQLPLTGQLDRCAAALDTLPTLRDLGRSEQSSSRASRRSRINALNCLGFHPGGISIECLPFIFPSGIDSI